MSTLTKLAELVPVTDLSKEAPGLDAFLRRKMAEMYSFNIPFPVPEKPLRQRTEYQLDAKLLNGEIWRSPSMMLATTQWLANDQWILLGTPDKSANGGTVMCAHAEEDGKMFYTESELADRLEKNGWTRTPLALPEL